MSWLNVCVVLTTLSSAPALIVISGREDKWLSAVNCLSRLSSNIVMMSAAKVTDVLGVRS